MQLWSERFLGSLIVFRPKTTARKVQSPKQRYITTTLAHTSVHAHPGVQLTTNGSNLRGMWEFASSSDESILEDDDIYSNDIYAILKTYGVEMARAAILREMKGIFAVYNIDVNKRHLELIADYMVQCFARLPLNFCLMIARHLMEDTNHSIAGVFLRTHRLYSKLPTRQLQRSYLMRHCSETLTTLPRPQGTLF